MSLNVKILFKCIRNLFLIRVLDYEYDHPHKDQRFKYEFGPCIYIGWGLIATTFANGFLFILCDWKRFEKVFYLVRSNLK